MTETNRIEFKRELTRELDIEREIVAFLNYHEGGMLYIGIDDSGKPIGVQDIDGDMLNNKENFVFMDNFIRMVIPYAWLPSNSEDGDVIVLENSEENMIQLTERQLLIIKEIENVAANVAANVAVNTKYLSERLGVNRKTIQRELAGLVEKNLIKWVGSDKTGHWELIEKE